MQVIKFERWAETAAGERVIAPTPGGVFVAVHGITGSATVSVDRHRREQVSTGTGPYASWQFTGRSIWVPAAQVDVTPGVSWYQELGRPDAFTGGELRVSWSAPAEFVIAVLAAV